MQEKEQREYANYLEVGHNAFEFVLNFGQAYEAEGEPRIHTCIVTNPACAKAMLETMRSAMDAYESQYRQVGDAAI